MHKSKSERKADAIAERLVNVLAEIEMFCEDDPDMIFYTASWISTKKTASLSDMQLKAVRKVVQHLKEDNFCETDS